MVGGGPGQLSARVLALGLAAVLVALPPHGAARVAAQAPPLGDPLEAYQRVLQLGGWSGAGSFTVRPVAASGLASAPRSGHPWAARFAPDGSGALRWTVGDSRLRLIANTRHPEGANDGALWQGRGITTAFDTRATLAWRSLSVTFDPLLIYNQNTDFALAPPASASLPAVAYPWHVIDYPQRFGTDPFWTLDPGPSEVALDWKGARFSFGNAGLWWGPGIENAIVMSDNAPGFLHASVATGRPLDIGIGTLEGQWIWGGLGQSEWFDPALEDVDRFLTGIVLTWSPSFIPGLSLGGTRVFQQLVDPSGLDPVEYFLVLQGLLKAGQVSDQAPDGTDERDQILSIFARWAFPAAGFEAYVEWARNDHAWDLRDLLLEPEHSQAYTIGFQHLVTAEAARYFVLRGELTHLEAPPTFQVRPRGVYYTHGVVTQGYTHEGQILGAAIGPGSNSQFLGFDAYTPRGMASFFLRRRVRDNDAYWVWAEANGITFDRHDVSFDFGATALTFVDDFELTAGIVMTRQLNRYFFGRHENNVNLSTSVRWRPDLR